MAEPSPLGRSCARALSTAGEASSEPGGTFHRPIARLSGRPKEVETPKPWGSPAGVGVGAQNLWRCLQPPQAQEAVLPWGGWAGGLCGGLLTLGKGWSQWKAWPGEALVVSH